MRILRLQYKEDSLRLLDTGVDEADFVTEMYALTKAREENILKIQYEIIGL